VWWVACFIVVGRGLESLSGQSKDYEIGICFQVLSI